MPAQVLYAPIQAALNTFDTRQFRASNLALLNALGYSSDRTQAIPGADPQAFRKIAESHSGKNLNADKAKFADWKQADLLFQFTDEELSEHKGLFQDAAINASQTRSYLFFAIELSGPRYSRTDLATIARQINRLFPMPVMVTFSYDGKLSIAVINRRQHKRDESRDVLGNVSLIREIDTSNPHRAHLDVLQELSLSKRLKWADDHNKPRNFDGLLAAWLAVLDTEELNRQFYKDLFAWFERAVTTASFPTDEANTLKPEEHVIRLITRLLFVWFIKEKGLIADDLFNETRIADLLEGYDPDAGDSYYRAVLQNLFFATLNTEIDKRGFSKETHDTHRDFSRYRYKAEMRDPEKLLKLFRRTPFINGGLFDCLDTEAATRDGGWRIDCFTDNPRSRSGYSIPNRLFFSWDKDNPGLITLFDKYKFTVEENTPAEQEVALDPELLGKVFENLLAAYNPETRDTARKQTGSYYTPRAVVDYMVDEALTAYLSENTHPTNTAGPHEQKQQTTPQPSASAPQPSASAAQPSASASPPAASTAPPAASTAPPSASAVPPAASAVQPAASTPPPSASAVPPSASAVPPSASAVPPSASAVQPAASASQPSASAVPPSASAAPPSASAAPPSTSAVQPAASAIQPAASAAQPAASAVQPAASAPQPSASAIQLAASTPVIPAPPPVIPAVLSGNPSDTHTNHWQQRIRYLLDYTDPFDDAEDLFTPTERDNIIQAIATIKVLDPAVGSGAFPMGILHKLTLALRRLDPDNTRWETLQKDLAGQKAASAFNTQNRQERDAELDEISATFEHYRDSDFGRKLYLIQNSIYGVDIQPVASQIAKLRFFISLAIEQEPTGNAKDNYGIKPLPNLETRFVAANTLLALENPAQLTLGQTKAVQKLVQELTANRERHFHATTRDTKRKYRAKDKELRDDLAAALLELGYQAAAADKIANWDPYDQNARADWCDPEYMFGVTKGFDVVIGNPPYIQLQKNAGELGRLYKDAGFETFASTGDIYQLFYEKACHLLTPQRGLLSYITSNSWLKAEYGKKTRHWFAERHTPLRLLEMGKDVFENAIVDTNILIARSGKSDEAGKAVDMDRLSDKTFPPTESLWGPLRTQGERPWSALSAREQSIMDKMEAAGTLLREWDVKTNVGVITGYNNAFIIDNATRQALLTEDPNSAEIIKPVLRGRDIKRYQAQWADLWLIDTHNGYGNVPAVNIDDYPAIKTYLDRFYPKLEKRHDKGKSSYNLRNCAYHEEFTREKLFWMDLTEEGRFAYDAGEMFCVNTVYMMSGQSIKYLCAVLNSNLITWFMKNTALTSGMGVTRWFRVFVEAIPIPKIPAAKQRPFIRLVDHILQTKASDPSADTTKPETEIDRLVYGLYGLTEEEIVAVGQQKLKT